MKYLTRSFATILLLQLFIACNTNTTSEKEKDRVTKKAELPPDSTRRIVILDPEAATIVDSTAAIEIIASGFKWSEGPLFIEDDGYLLFSDIPNNKVYKWKEGTDTSTFLYPAGFTGVKYEGREPGSNGLLLGKKGELILLQHGDRRVAAMQASLDKPMPQYKTLADKFEGKRFNSPNDAVLAGDGSIYFTDPPYGLAKLLADTAKELSFQGVFVVRPSGKVELLTDEIKFPNGITLSPDGKFLIVANSDPANKVWMKYMLDEKGLVKSKTIFYRATADEGIENGSPDGLKISKAGYVFATGPGGLWLFNPTGKVIARIYTGQPTSNCALNKDEKQLFLTCGSYVMRIKLK